jgi:hypothetical protein
VDHTVLLKSEMRLVTSQVTPPAHYSNYSADCELLSVVSSQHSPKPLAQLVMEAQTRAGICLRQACDALIN